MATRRYRRGTTDNLAYFGVTRETIDWLKNVNIEDLNVRAGVYKGKYYPQGDDWGKRKSMVQVAMENEYGNFRKRIPPRPIFRYAKAQLTSTGELEKILEEDLIDKTKRISDSEKKIDIPMKTKHKLGQAVLNQLRRTTENKKRPPNRPATIEKKGRDDPLVETRKMIREGLEYRINGRKQRYKGNVR